MIINTILQTGIGRQNIQLDSSDIFLKKLEGDDITISFSYSNSEGLSGHAVLFLNNEAVLNDDVLSGGNGSFDLTPLLTQTGYYIFKLIVVDSEKSVDSLDFKILYNFQNIGDFSFVYNSGSDSYILSAYTGTSSDISIPPIIDGNQGLKAVAAISNGVFFDNDILESVVIPSSIASIGANAFFSCSNLREVVIEATTPPILGGDNVFDPYTELSLLKIYVPSASVNLYKSAQYWSEYANDIYATVE
jgi:hypothetical protein